jgi:heterodisulfide reductase subunit B
MKYAYYPGCSAESTARDMHESSLAVAKVLGIEMVEPKGWICCGATAGHQTDEVLAATLPAASLVKVRDMGMDMLVNCAACYNRMKTANYKIVNDPDMRKKVSVTLERDYDGSVNVRHFVEVLLEDVGLERIKELIKRPLNGLKVASYYGCLLVRPHEVTGFDDPENPTSLDKLVEMMGGEALDWPHKVECCGGGLSLSRTDVVIELTESIVGMAKAAGADCIVVCCPMCQINLDLRQQDIEKQMSKRYDMPILYITQLLGLCLGISSKKLGLSKLMVSPEKIVKAIGEVA